MLLGKMYIFGGAQVSKVEHSDELLAVHFVEEKVLMEHLPMGPCRQGHSTVVWKKQLVVFGGTGLCQFHSYRWTAK